MQPPTSCLARRSCPSVGRKTSPLVYARTSTRTSDEINEGIKAALGKLNGTAGAAVAMMTGLSADELDELVGLPQ